MIETIVTRGATKAMDSFAKPAGDLESTEIIVGAKA
jgi:hypothetical protein